MTTQVRKPAGAPGSAGGQFEGRNSRSAAGKLEAALASSTDGELIGLRNDEDSSEALKQRVDALLADRAVPTSRDITDDQWEDTYKPHTNKFGEICMYETYGEDFEAVKNAAPGTVWTYVDGGDYAGVVSGMAFVNRIGYYICETPYSEEETGNIYADFGVVESDDCCTECGEEFSHVNACDEDESICVECCEHEEGAH